MLKALSFCTALLSMVLLQACSPATQDTERMASHHLTLSEANKLVELPLHCVETPYPYKTGAVLGSAADLSLLFCIRFFTAVLTGTAPCMATGLWSLYYSSTPNWNRLTR